jgi:hypothetical protein
MADLTFTGLKEMQRSYAKAGRAMAAGEARAVKRVSTTIAAQQSRAIGDVLNLRIGTIKSALTIVQQPTAATPRVVFQVKGKGIALSDYLGTRMTKAGLSVQPIKGGKRSILPGVFISQKLGGKAYARASKANAKQYGTPRVGRLPIIKLYGPMVIDIYVRDDIQQVGINVWNERLEIELDRETTFALTQAGLL